jgi:hypothetical protein
LENWKLETGKPGALRCYSLLELGVLKILTMGFIPIQNPYLAFAFATSLWKNASPCQ